jgi:hypothetical protein
MGQFGIGRGMIGFIVDFSFADSRDKCECAFQCPGKLLARNMVR